MQRLGESVSFDWRLYKHDIEGSIAHAAALVAANVLTDGEFTLIETALKEIAAEIAQGVFQWKPELEDVHMNIESALTERIGAAGAKLHTARSRNDQVATATRLYLKEKCGDITQRIRLLQQALVAWAERSGRAYLPGYTHLQRAQPVYFAHHLLAYVEMLERDIGRLADAVRRMDSMPLGSGAIAGSTIPLDRQVAAQRLGFASLTRNSMDAVSDRDFVAETLWSLAMLGVHLSRFAEDVILWASAEFGFIKLSDSYTTGSSLMPQKKNPDAAELTRGKSGRLLGNLVSVLTMLKGLPMTYNRDLQEDKEPLFDSIDTVEVCLEALTGMVHEAEANPGRMEAAAADPLLLATDLADYLVRKGLPFRKAHEVVGRLTAHSVESGVSFPQMPLADYRAESELFEEDVFECLNPLQSLEARSAIGCPAYANVQRELAAWRTLLEEKITKTT